MVATDTSTANASIGQQQQQQQQQWSIAVPNTARKGERGDIRRWIDNNNNNNNNNNASWTNGTNFGPYLSLYGCRTLYETIRYGQQLNPLGPCLGYRTVSANTGFATPYIYYSYTETISRINCIAAGLKELQIVQRNSDNLLLLGIYVRNCVEWVLCEHAIYTLGGATVPFYDTLGPDVVQYILTHTDLSAVVCSQSEFLRLCDAASTGLCPKFTTAIVIDGITPKLQQVADAANVTLLSLAKIEAVGAKLIANQGGPIRAAAYYHNPPNPSDIATICYTSGTTGLPKGAMLSHENLVSAAVGTVTGIPTLEASICDRHLSYLPLPHIFERVVHITLLVNGASIAFYRGDPTKLIEDIQACQPTILPVVPRVLNKIYDKIINGITEAGGIKKKLFDRAVMVKTHNLIQYGKLTHPFYDRLLFNKIKTALGFGHLRGMISGSAPLPENVMIFFRILFGIPLVEGYGQTEGAAAATISHPDDIKTVGHVGGPTPTVEIALYDVPEMGYLSTDTTHGNKPCLGRGEICIRGPNVFMGYYKDIEKTNDTIDTEKWLHSGDIGLWRLDGTIQIIDRKKNLFKLAQGEYVAPEKIENILVRSAYIAQCFVYGDSYQNSLIAIIIPDEDIAKSWALRNNNNNKYSGLDNKTLLNELCTNDTTFRTTIYDDIQRLSKESKLNGFETVRAIHLSPIAFSVENDLLTPTFKLKRQQARDMYQHEINTLYNNLTATKSPTQQPTSKL